MTQSIFQNTLPTGYTFQEANGRVQVYNELEMLVASGRDFAEALFFINFSL
jgi:hypothetical protein